jgi:TolB protein
MNFNRRILSLYPIAVFAVLALSLSGVALAQDEVHVMGGTNGDRLRIAAASFKPANTDAQTTTLKATFDATFYNDLASAGIFDMVSRSMTPQESPGTPSEIKLAAWSAAPANASMVAFGSLGVKDGKLSVSGWLFDTHNSANPQVVGKQYTENAGQDAARKVAHQFADEIIYRLGGGINGIAETKIYYVSSRSGTKEIWAMDYDGQNAHAVTNLGTVSLSPRISPDNTKLAFASLGKQGWAIKIYSLELDRYLNFPTGTIGTSNLTPAWSGDGEHIAFSSSRGGDPDIWVADSKGAKADKLTNTKGPDVAPTWNPRSNAQIAWVSGRTGLPQIYIMDADGTNVQRLTDGGYAISPSWSPNGQFLTFSWNRKYGPGAPGGQDIYVMDIASKKWIQLTHGSGSNDFPSWAPDGRHIVFQRSVSEHNSDIWMMLADGTEQKQLTHGGSSSMPNWSWK